MSSESKYGIPCEVWESMLQIFRKQAPQCEVILYGSRAKGNFKPGSDIDLCLRDSAFTNRDMLALKTALDDLELPWEIDLAVYHNINNSLLIEHIDRVGIVIS